jgi:hypothetical protein
MFHINYAQKYQSALLRLVAIDVDKMVYETNFGLHN